MAGNRPLTAHDVRGQLAAGLRQRVAAARGDAAAPVTPAGVGARRILARGFGLPEDALDAVPTHKVAEALAAQTPLLRHAAAGQVSRQAGYWPDPSGHQIAANLLRARDRRSTATGGGGRAPRPQFAGTPDEWSRAVTLELAAALNVNPNDPRFQNAGVDSAGRPSLDRFAQYAHGTPEMARAVHQQAQRAAAAADALDPLSPTTVRGLLGSRQAVDRALDGVDAANKRGVTR